MLQYFGTSMNDTEMDQQNWRLFVKYMGLIWRFPRDFTDIFQISGSVHTWGVGRCGFGLQCGCRSWCGSLLGGRGSNDRNLPKKTSKKRVDMLTEMIHSHISMSKKNTDPIHMILILYGISEAMQPVASQTPWRCGMVGWKVKGGHVLGGICVRIWCFFLKMMSIFRNG